MNATYAKTVTGRCEFFHHTVVDFIETLLINPGGDSKYNIVYEGYPECSLDQDPDKFDILIEDARVHQLIYKFQFDRKTMKHSEFLHQIVTALTETWDI